MLQIPIHQGQLLEAQSLEAKLLLGCARTHMDLITADQVEALCQTQLDWQRVLELAAHHGVGSLLHQNLQDVCPDLVPEAVRDRLSEWVQTCTLNNVFFTQELLKLLRCLEQHQIPALPYKGSVLTATLYGSLALRPFCDVDILIQPEHLVQAKALLVELGYDTLQVDDRLEVANIWSDTERDFIRRDRSVVLDLHWRITPRFFPFELPVAALWQRRQFCTLLGEAIATLAPEDLLVCLCVHGAKECWGKLKWICDVAELLRVYPSLDWELVWRHAEQFHVDRMVRLGLALAAAMLDAKLPASVQQRIDADRVVPKLIPQVYGYLFGELPQGTHRMVPIVFRVWVRDRWQNRVQYFVWRLFVPNVRDRQMLVLPQSLSGLYYLMRPVRLVAEKFGWLQRPVLGEEVKPGTMPDGIIRGSDANQGSDRPRRKALEGYDLGDELLLYHEEQELGITLNSSSKQIWQLCDGTCSVSEIAAKLGQQIGCDRDTLLEDVYLTVMKFRESGLLEN